MSDKVEEKIRRSSFSRCRICLLRKELTEEHIFPKCLSIPGTKQIRELLPKIDPKRRGGRVTRLSQNGLKLKTTCSNCKNNLLGQIYDPALKFIYDQAGLFIRNRKFLYGNIITLEKIELNKVVRAVIGHMLAADEVPNAKSLKCQEMRRFFFNHEHVFSENISVLMWVYPTNEQAVIRDIFLSENFGTGAIEFLWISAYKTFPLAFAIAHKDKKTSAPYKNIINLTSHLTKNINDKFDIRLSIKGHPPFMWPETPSRNEVILMGDGQRLLTKPHSPIRSYKH